jgi:TolB-like protein
MTAAADKFGPFVFERERMMLARDGVPCALGGRGTALLAALVDADGEVVRKEALMEAAWPGTIVEEGNLSVQIAALRKALGQRPDGSEWIATVPRVGYRLVRDTAAILDTVERGLPSLAVLPFENLSNDPEQEYFADGVVEDIITALSRFRFFSVAARNSSFVYKGRAVDVRQVAKELQVRYVLGGSVRRAGNRLRIAAQLVDGIGGGHIWARTFEGSLDDVFEMQDRITESVAGEVGPSIRSAEVEAVRLRPESADAYDLFLRAMTKLGNFVYAESAEGLALIERAIALDPGYTRAVAMAAWAYEHRIHMGWPPVGEDDVGRCLSLARAALAATRDDAHVIAHCGVILQLCANEWEQGLRTIERALTVNPNEPAAHFFGGVGNIKGGTLDAAAQHFRRLIELNPLESDGGVAGLGYVHLFRGEYEEALEHGARALAMRPTFGWIHWLVIAGNAYLGRADAARQALGVYREMFPQATLGRIRFGQRTEDLARGEVLVEGLRLAGMPED